MVKAICYKAASSHVQIAQLYSQCGAKVYPHLTHDTLAPHESTPPEPLFHLFRPFTPTQTESHTYPQTTERATFVATGRIYVMHTTRSYSDSSSSSVATATWAE